MLFDSVVILDGVRTPIGGFGGSLAGLAPHEMGTLTAREALTRSGLAAEAIDHAVYGHIITTGPQDAYLARHIARDAGVPDSAAALNVNRLCGSGVQALISAAQQIALGDSHFALAGGAESMSRGAYLLPPQARFGLRMGHAGVTDLTLGILSDPFGSGHMGCTAENIASRYGLTREAVDQFALESHRKAAHAIAEGRFIDQILPVTVREGKGERVFAQDEHVREAITLEDLARLRPAFQKDGLVTAGNASGLNDGAASLVLADADEAARHGLKARARMVAATVAGVEPGVMGLGPIPAVTRCLEQAGLAIGDIDVIESNEAFAAQAMAVAQALDFPAERLNPNGGAVGLGHPVGATGAILVIKALAELERTGGRYGLITLCIGGGQGIALLIERCA
ncbi:beta-ketothiolase BktB [Halomonas campisalis]|uniref:Beta-ketothiolase BktB n=1 Tax=Billgrantia campisalis TaxID=74661 RepID=A0ABS9PAR9_9GAMM|nr:beta-ketothiolase BktB [Halomonas campisalis]MCG6658836.1 beta-ketothiolase BktB [Halomonas campisalis]MDR5864515.1 beta-ketothiolase BktB [Halomonas campisalis]